MSKKQTYSILSFTDWYQTYSINESNYNNYGFSINDIMKIQSLLVSNSFMLNIRSNGKSAVDGMFGEESKAALMKYQQSKGLSPTGVLDNETLSSFGLKPTTRTGSTTPPVEQIVPDMKNTPITEPKDIKPGVEKLSKVADRDGDYCQIIDPSSIKLVFEPNFSKYSASGWIQKGYNNFINLTYYEGNGRPSSNFYSNGVNLGAKLGELGYWPFMMLKPKVQIIKSGKEVISPIEGFSGSSMVVMGGQVISKNMHPREAAVRQRTGVGITASGDIVVYVTKRANVNTLGQKMQLAGAVYAVNVDGGNSTMFVRDGQILVATSRPIPTILAW